MIDLQFCFSCRTPAIHVVFKAFSKMSSELYARKNDFNPKTDIYTSVASITHRNNILGYQFVFGGRLAHELCF
jgi:hypothetical protein